METPLDVIVVGAGIGGLGSALAFSRAGHRVTVLERDDTPMPADVDGAFEWDRRGAPQVRHTHGFVGLLRVLLRDRFPDVLDALTDAGVRTASLADSELIAIADEEVRARVAADDDLKVLLCRRTTLEWVLRRCALAEPDVSFRVGAGVTGLIADSTETSVPVLRGVTLEDGSTVPADLVVVTTGRRSDLPAWLAEHGVEVPETTVDTGSVYLSRFYRSGDPDLLYHAAGRAAGLSYVMAGADADTYSATVAVDADDRELRKHLRDSDRFEATLRVLPQMSKVVERQGTPITPVQVMGGLINRLRRYTDANGNPLAVGVMAVGDAHTCTNPLYGRGSSLAMLQAVLAADAVAGTSDLESASRRYEADCARDVEPWFHFSVMSDQMMRRGGKASGGVNSANGGGDVMRLMFSAMQDPELAVKAMRVMNLLASPYELLAAAGSIQQSTESTTSRNDKPSSTPRPPRVTRDDILAVVA